MEKASASTTWKPPTLYTHHGQWEVARGSTLVGLHVIVLQAAFNGDTVVLKFCVVLTVFYGGHQSFCLLLAHPLNGVHLANFLWHLVKSKTVASDFSENYQTVLKLLTV